MDFEAAQQRVEALRERIEYHSKRYYDEDAPEIEDDEFDASAILGRLLSTTR